MLNFLPAFIRGALVLFFISLSTCVLFPVLLVLALLKLLIPLHASRKLLTEMLIGIATIWIGINNFLLDSVSKTAWDVQGIEQLSPNDWYFVTCNHQSWADILIVQKTLNRKIPMLKFFLKQQLIWVPLMGIAWWALDFPFMKRYTKEEIEKNPALKGKDLETTRKACEKFKYTPVTVFNFLEGTRLTPEKHARQQSPYMHLLKPKAGGAAFVLGAMGEMLHTMLNITIHYPDRKGFWELVSGQLQKITVIVEKVEIPEEFLSKDYINDESFRSEFQRWVTELWLQKDRLLAELHEAS